MKFLSSASGKKYLKSLDWCYAFDKENITAHNEFNFDNCYTLLTEYLHLNKTNEIALNREFFFSLLYVTDSGKLKKYILRDIKDSEKIECFYRRKSHFTFSDNDVYLWKIYVQALIEGKTEDEALQIKADTVKLLEEEKKEKEKANKERLLSQEINIPLKNSFLDIMDGLEEIDEYIKLSEYNAKKYGDKYFLS